MSKKENLLKFWESIESHQHTKEPIEIIKPRSPYRHSGKSVAQLEPLRSQAKDLSPKQKSVSAKVKLSCWGGDKNSVSKEGNSPYKEKSFPILPRNEVLSHATKSRAKRSKRPPTRKKKKFQLVVETTPPAAKDEFVPCKSSPKSAIFLDSPSPTKSVLARRSSFTTYQTKQREDEHTAVPISPKSSFTVSKAALNKRRNSLNAVKSSLPGISALEAATTPSIVVAAAQDVKSLSKIGVVVSHTGTTTPIKAVASLQDVKSPSKLCTVEPKNVVTPFKALAAFHEVKSPLKLEVFNINAKTSSPFKAALTAFQDVKTPSKLNPTTLQPTVATPVKALTAATPSKAIHPSIFTSAVNMDPRMEKVKKQTDTKSGDVAVNTDVLLDIRSDFNKRAEKLEQDLKLEKLARVKLETKVEVEKIARVKLEREVEELKALVTKLTNSV